MLGAGMLLVYLSVGSSSLTTYNLVPQVPRYLLPALVFLALTLPIVAYAMTQGGVPPGRVLVVLLVLALLLLTEAWVQSLNAPAEMTAHFPQAGLTGTGWI